MSPPMAARYAFITPSGWGNLGDAAIVDSLIHGIRRRVPGAEIVGYTLHHLDTTARHGVEAHPITSFSLPYYPVLPSWVEGPYELPRYDGSDRPDEATASPGAAGRVRDAVRRRMWSVRATEFAIGVVRARGEPGARRALRDALAGTRGVMVAGGGQLDALFGGVWGQPYVLLRWARLARDVGADFEVLSVGTGTLDGPERWVTRRALRSARHRSYRDTRSRELLRDRRLTDGDPIVPDLAYALPSEPRPLPTGGPIVVGVSPMNYRHPDFYPAADRGSFDEHVTGMHRICRRLLELGIEVELFTTDASDDVGLAAVATRLEGDGIARGDGWRIAGARTVDELMATYARTHAVVAARLHGVLLAHVAHRPALALAHERKVRTLMSEMGHERFCFDLGRVQQPELDRRIDELIERRDRLAVETGAAVERFRSRVEQQYDRVFGPVAGRADPAA